MADQLRRAAPRQPTDWMAYYRLDNAEDSAWRPCRILDISPLGAGLELHDIAADEVLDGAITVSFELRGESRNIVRSEDGTTARFGIQFPELTESAKEYLNRLDGKRW